ncbi:bifunctional D-glycero-beta-D-manno-heptose-7-phosphate kinase/D-glycero-beta-D-manno-heptose 1-phosphate adenylyltransferase HldE [Nitrosococcus watsonii]|uniref:Bifunctional protein HldE n=1 Tax=Nitrosococcus watsoni (strain C-113) TaxID=105559 RepID=D8KAF5_NITWC|nr:bifunctional D-glycero-beta-D-manno-heptose-7-phosphate kinase/D-glycero-beta-D-manno-heptose 1-phosphate adenylyltransferase HldE [Nitrosococcus watsonii]ADJ27470.1 rfaE bifunctional protein [Nitrosococcus watsonii C-113]
MTHGLPDFTSAQVLVIGDVMLDRYWHGTTSRISPEAPVPVVRVTEREDRPGGAGNVAVNVATLGAQVTLLGLIGVDEAAATLRSLLTQRGVHCCLEEFPDIATLTKLRVISRHQQLIRLDFEDGFIPAHSKALLPAYNAALSGKSAVILSDYGKGTLQEPQGLIALGRKAGVPILIDPKGVPFSRYRGASIITPNLAEFEAVVGPCADEMVLVEKGEQLRQQLALEALLITRGEQGMTLLQREHFPLHLPTEAREVFDVTGAGDTVISVLGAALAAGGSFKEATLLANQAAGIVVGKLGTASVTRNELQQVLHPRAIRRGITSEEELLHFINLARSRGECIVMTNGCFDILHSGHVSYLAEAHQLGDRLIVAVNDDASVQRLKGKSRPINSLAQRLAVLAALHDVDWVVPFSEDTPARLIERVLPNILVKGGDYAPEQVAGASAVVANGGKIIILNYQQGCSTSQIIEIIRKS